MFPPQTVEYILSFQFSSWYTLFKNSSIKSTIIRPLDPEFIDYLKADGVYVPEGSEDNDAGGESSEDEDEDEEPRPRYTFPQLDAQIRSAIASYGSVFPKLNFSSPKDASWILLPTSPLKCTTPADVYLLLKSSNFISHDLNPEYVFEGCDSMDGQYEIELVLRKWYPVETSRELRCFVRNGDFIAISQRDSNYYEFLNDPETQTKIVDTVHAFWQSTIKSETGWKVRDYIFDFLLTRDLSRGHIIDFNPYSPRTDSLLCSYDTLDELVTYTPPKPVLHVINSRLHPAANTLSPAHQHNMMPFEALSMSNGQDIEEFAAKWKSGLLDAM